MKPFKLTIEMQYEISEEMFNKVGSRKFNKNITCMLKVMNISSEGSNLIICTKRLKHALAAKTLDAMILKRLSTLIR